MEENRFFRFAWRFNAVTFMAASVLAILVLCLAAFQMFRERGARHRSNIVNVESDGRVDEKLKLGHAKTINGNPCLMVPLLSEQSYAQSYYGKSTQSIRNYLFVNTQTKESRWLFPGTQYLILHDHLLNKYGQPREDKVVEAILYDLVKQDTDNDKRFTERDAHTIALSSPSGDHFTELLDGVEQMLGHFVVDDKRLMMLYQKAGIGYSSEISLSDFKTISTEPLPKPR